LRASAAPATDASPLPPTAKEQGSYSGSANAPKKSGPVCLSSPNRATESPESCKLLALKIELGSRLAAGARRVAPRHRGRARRRRLPETSAPMVICAAGLSPVRGLPHRKRPHYCLLTPSPSCAAGSLASARSPRTARIPQARRLLCSSTGQRCCLAHAGVSHGVLTRRAHTARSYTAYAQLNASPSPPRPHPLFS